MFSLVHGTVPVLWIGVCRLPIKCLYPLIYRPSRNFEEVRLRHVTGPTSPLIRLQSDVLLELLLTII